MSLDKFTRGFGSFWRGFYNEETQAFTFSVLRDLWKSLLIVLVLVVFFIFLKLTAAVGYPKSRLEVWDWIHYISSTVALTYIFLNFLGKLYFGTRGKGRLLQ